MPEPETNGGFVARWKALPVDSVPKTLFVAITLCLFCSMIVAAAAVALRPVQEANKLRDKQLNILQVAGLYEPGINVAEAFKAFEPRVVDLETGTFTDRFDAASFDDRAAASDPDLSQPLTDDPAGIGRQGRYQVVYLLNDAQGDLERIILPIHGYGLWSTLWGFIALGPDGNEIYGLQFYDQAETPGLGAEVDNPRWKALWHGKKLRDEDGALQINVSKGAPNAAMAPYHVDALAGATLTSRGVDNLVRFWMGEAGFAPFLENLKTGAV
ncbi:Na(+)-translocating NADH-quinone reductase subunit C [Tropicimonas sp. IMCC34043]|uniref:Na(+)-translocating NADH-quinone reductase subunit C n=1 Tax=Tropicimonas sp. IMCC34043 TaxID=2248760 RepID=UPI000E23814B|nr:Na(+)-translocating NADH-quinone reductase subunit C [Tropicimonas sp. IMCC34043]